jgi:cytosine/adenosine deaminase-related metal-dependent hydrolase
MSFTIQNVLIPVADNYQTVDVQIEGDKIHAIAPNLPPQGTIINGKNKLLLPGFVNAHTHSSEIWQRGMIPPFPLELWLVQLCDFGQLTLDQVYLGVLTTAIETILSGGTSVVDHLLLIPGQERESIATAVQAYKDVGIRAFLAPLIQDEPITKSLPSGNYALSHSPYYRTTNDVLEMMEDVIKQFHHPENGINIVVAPTGFQMCSDAFFQGCIELSDRDNLCRHSHLLETRAQQMLAYEKYGVSAVQHLKDIGYLSPKTSLAHSVWLEDNDIKILAETQSTVVHNPLSNLRLGSGIAPILKYLKAGVNVSFGCDGASSNDGQDLLEVIKMGTILHNTTDFEYRNWITPRKAIEMASLGGAKGLKLEDKMGSLTIGKNADLVLYDLTKLSLLPRTDPMGLLVLGRPNNVVESVWINGNRIVEKGEVKTINIDDLKRELWEKSQWNFTRESPLLQEFEPRYRAVMNLDK